MPAGTMPVLCDPIEAKRRPQSDYEAKFSVPYAVASGLLRGRLGLRELLPAAFGDGEAIALMDRIHCVADPASTFPQHYTGEIVVTLDDGREDPPSRGDQPRPRRAAAEERRRARQVPRQRDAALLRGRTRAVCESVLALDRAESIATLDRLLGRGLAAGDLRRRARLGPGAASWRRSQACSGRRAAADQLAGQVDGRSQRRQRDAGGEARLLEHQHQVSRSRRCPTRRARTGSRRGRRHSRRSGARRARGRRTRWRRPCARVVQVQAEPVDGQLRQQAAEELLHLRRPAAPIVSATTISSAPASTAQAELEDALGGVGPSNGHSNATAR